jgi:transposase
MGRRLQLRAVSEEERAAVKRLAHSRTASARAVERAQVVETALAGAAVEEIAVRLHLSRATIYLWLHRFEERGIAGLQDHPRGGRPPTSSREQVSQIIATALERPEKLGLPSASWTLDRLVAYLAEQYGITMKRSRLDEVLLSEGLRWRKQENWFGERVDPEFAAKRGPSSSSTPLPPPTASSSASTRWVRKRQRPSRARLSST